MEGGKPMDAGNAVEPSFLGLGIKAGLWLLALKPGRMCGMLSRYLPAQNSQLSYFFLSFLACI